MRKNDLETLVKGSKDVKPFAQKTYRKNNTLEMKKLHGKITELHNDSTLTDDEKIEELSRFELATAYQKAKLTKQRDYELTHLDALVHIQEEEIERALASKSFIDFIKYVEPRYRFSVFNRKLINDLQLAFEGKITRIIINMPPRHGKTQTLVLFIAFCLGVNPTEEVFNVSYNEELATTSSKMVLDIINTQEYKNVFPDFKFKKGSQTANHWLTEKNGQFLATGINGSITGRGFTIAIIDDIIKNNAQVNSEKYRNEMREWYTGTFLNRQQVSKRADPIIIINQTRWHTDDLVGFLEEKEKEGKQKWHKIIFQAFNPETGKWLFPEMFSDAKYEELRDNMPTPQFQALYQQDPLASMGTTFNQSAFRYFYYSDFENTLSGETFKKENFIWGVHIDPAFSSATNADDTAIILLGYNYVTKKFLVFDIDGGKLLPSESYSKIFQMLDRADVDGIKIQYISIEITNFKRQSNFYYGFEQELKNSSRKKSYKLVGYKDDTNKVERISLTLEPLFQQERILFPNKKDVKVHARFDLKKAINKLEDQLIKFPGDSHDDYPDVLTQGVIQLPVNGKNYKDIEKKREEAEKRRSNRVVINPITGVRM